MQNVGMILYISIVVVALYGALRGARKGLYKSLIDIGVTIVSALLSVWISKLISKSLVSVDSLIEGIDSMISRMPDFADTLNMVKDLIIDFSTDANVVGMVLSLPAVILTPFIFMILYLVIGFVLKIPKAIVARSIFGKNGGETYRGGSRIFGGAIGALVRVLSLAIFIIPIIGYINLANDTLLRIGQISTAPDTEETVEIETVEYSEDGEEYEEEAVEGEDSLAATLASVSESCAQIQANYIAPINDNFAIKAIYTCGGKWIFNSLSSAKVDEIKVSLKDEMDVLTSIYADATHLLNAPIAEYGEEQITAVTNITNTLDNAKIMPYVVSGILSHISQAWLDGEEVFGYGKINVGEYYEPTLDKLLTLLAGTTESTIKQDIHTVGNVVNICIKRDFFSEVLGGGNVMNVVQKEEFMGEIFVELHKNDTSRPLIQDMLNAFRNYLYRVYNDVNGTSIPYPNQLNMEAYTELMMYSEGALVASIMKDFNAFYATFNSAETDNTKLLIETDLRSLGRALDKLETSILLGDTYQFLLEAILKSQGAAQLQFLTPDFIEMILNSDSSMETILVARQQIAIIISATSDPEDREIAIEHLLLNVDADTASVIKETLTPAILKDFGMNSEKSEALSKTVSSLIDEIAANESNMSEEQMKNEVAAVDKIVSTVHAATDEYNKGSDLFVSEGGDGSMTEMTADELVKTVMDSSIVSSAMVSAATDENGNEVQDPYNISDKLTEKDKTSTKDALEKYYSENALPDADNTDLENTLKSLATVFGVEIELNK